MSVDSQSPEFKQGKINVLYICLFFPRMPCSSPDPKFPTKSKASKGQLQNMNSVTDTVSSALFSKSLTQCLRETWTMLELHKEIIQMTNVIINVPILFIIYLLNTYKKPYRNNYILNYRVTGLYHLIQWVSRVRNTCHLPVSEVQENLMECSRIENKTVYLSPRRGRTVLRIQAKAE